MEFGTVDVWLGRFASESAFNQFFAEAYIDELPVSRFATAMNKAFIDHDFLECCFRPEANSLRELLEGLSYATSFTEEVERKWVDTRGSSCATCLRNQRTRRRVRQANIA